MEIRSFNNELAIANLMFKRLFSNIQIDRISKDNTKKTIDVNCLFGQRSRVIKNWENPEKRGKMKLPMIIINRTGYSRNAERLNNLHNEVKYEKTGHQRIVDLMTPIPIDISYDVTIMAKYPSDIDQIASNFMIFFNSSLYVSCMHPKYEGLKLNNQVIMSDSVSEEHPDEIDGSADDFVTSTFQFTFKTYLFGGNQVARPRVNYILSTYTETVISDQIFQIQPEDIDQFQIENPDTDVSATRKISVDIDRTVAVDANGNILSSIDPSYDGFTPIIKAIDVGFYAVPRQEEFESWMTSVDNGDFGEDWPYVDRIVWKIREDSPNVFPYNVYPYSKNSPLSGAL